MKQLDNYGQDWVPFVFCKQQAFLALAQYQQSLVCKSKKDTGEELARLTVINAFSEKIPSPAFANGLIFMQYANKIIQEAMQVLAAAKNDNDFIYHKRIPDTLPVIEKAPLAKPETMNSPRSKSFKGENK